VKKVIGKGIFVIIIIVLSITVFTVGFMSLNSLNAIQAENSSLQASKDDLQSNYESLQNEYNRLNNEYHQLTNGQPQDSSQITALENQIASLQRQLSNATTLISQLQGPTGILPTYLDLVWEGADTYHGHYFLRMSLKNTGNLAISQVFVNLNSKPVSVNFLYLNVTISAEEPLPAFQTAITNQDVSSIVNSANTKCQLDIQALATNGTIYTYQTSVTSHV
jgi:hypothetical protein